MKTATHLKKTFLRNVFLCLKCLSVTVYYVVCLITTAFALLSLSLCSGTWGCLPKNTHLCIGGLTLTSATTRARGITGTTPTWEAVLTYVFILISAEALCIQESSTSKVVFSKNLWSHTHD